MTQIHSQETYQHIRQIEQILNQHMALWGYETKTLPIIEPATVFLTRAGDNIISKLFTFERYGKQLALRPEFTAAAAYEYGANKYDAAVRWQFSGAIFEDDPSDLSLQYQTHSIGAELIGQKGIMADAEIISMAASGVQKLGLDDWQIVTGHVGLQQHLLAQFQLDSRVERLLLSQRDVLKDSEHGLEEAQQALKHALAIMHGEDEDQTDISSNSDNGSTQRMLDVLLDSTRYGATMGGRSRQDIAKRLLHKRARIINYDKTLAALNFFDKWVGIEEATIEQGFEQISIFLHADDALGQRLLQDWRTTVETFIQYGIPEDRIRIQANLTRNWEYYTGIVYGVQSTKTGNFIAGGGRYDGLTRLLSGDQASPAVGFVYYIEPLLESLPEYTPEKQQITLFAKPEDSASAIQWAQALRERNNAVVITPTASPDAVIVQANGTATVGDSNFSLNDVEQLIQNLKVTSA